MPRPQKRIWSLFADFGVGVSSVREIGQERITRMSHRNTIMVKPVPCFGDLTLGPDGRVTRDGMELELNPYCRRAVSNGVELASGQWAACALCSRRDCSWLRTSSERDCHSHDSFKCAGRTPGYLPAAI